MKALAPVLCLLLASCFPQQSGGGGGTDATSTQSGTTTLSPGAQAASSTTTTTTPGASKTVTFDSSKKMEIVDVYVEMGDPNGQRALVPYLMKPEDWMLIKCEMTSTTSKHYRFQRVTTQDGRSLPQVDIFKQGR